MAETVREKISRVNGRLAGMLEDARRALRGEANFGVENIQKIREPLEEMAGVVAESSKLRELQPDLAGDLDLYKTQLGELQTNLTKIRMMLLARQASMEAGRAQLSAVSQWISAYRQTR